MSDRHYAVIRNGTILTPTREIRDGVVVIEGTKIVEVGRAGATHVCYCHTPMRYVWAMYEEYFGGGQGGRIARIAVPFIANYLRTWDVSSSQRVDAFVANSENVRKRIWRYYRREAEVVFPPVDTENTWLSPDDDGYFLIVSAFAPYKKVDVAIEAFNGLREKLVIVGSGQQESRLKRMARGNIEFVGWAEPDELRKYYAGCRALIFPGEEDFGIVPVEAQCFGKPVIAFGRGGVLETVIGRSMTESKGGGRGRHTGIFYHEQAPERLREAVRSFRKDEFEPRSIREHALKFDRTVFREKISEFITRQLSSRSRDGSSQEKE